MDAPAPTLAGEPEKVYEEQMGGLTIVTSVALATGEPAAVAVTWLATCRGAFAATLTVTVMAGKLALVPSVSPRVQMLEVQFQAEPDMETSVRPEGMLSVTVIAPVVGAPLLLTVTVY